MNTIFIILLVIVLLVVSPYLAVFFLSGIHKVLSKWRIIKTYLEFLNSKDETIPPTQKRLKDELDRIEKKETGKITRIATPIPNPQEPSGVFVDSPTPEEEKIEAEAELEKEQKALKEKLEKADKK